MSKARVLTIFAYIWFGITGSLIAFCYLMVALKSGFGELQRIMSPFNVWNYLAILITLAPGIGALSLAKKLEKK